MCNNEHNEAEQEEIVIYIFALIVSHADVAQVINAKLSTYAPTDVFRASVRILNLPTFFFAFFFLLFYLLSFC